MDIDKKLVKKIATLSRIKIEENEVERFSNELSKIISWVEKLNGTSSLETVIKTVVGDAAYITEQEFSTIEDAYADRNPLTKAKATVADIRINNTRYKLKKEDKNVGTV